MSLHNAKPCVELDVVLGIQFRVCRQDDLIVFVGRGELRAAIIYIYIRCKRNHRVRNMHLMAFCLVYQPLTTHLYRFPVIISNQACRTTCFCFSSDTYGVAHFFWCVTLFIKFVGREVASYSTYSQRYFGKTGFDSPHFPNTIYSQET
jgi:hypothetical protein